MSIDDRMSTIAVKQTNLKPDLSIDHRDQRFVGKDDLNTPSFAPSKSIVDKGEQKCVEDQRPGHLKINNRLQGSTLLFKERIGKVRQRISCVRQRHERLDNPEWEFLVISRPKRTAGRASLQRKGKGTSPANGLSVDAPKDAYTSAIHLIMPDINPGEH